MGSSSSGESTVRYAEYFENAHSAILNHSGEDEPDSSIIDVLNATLGTSPYGSAVITDPEPGFFGTGYTIASFPSLWDMFGKFMAGLDVHLLWEQTYNGIRTSPEIEASITAHRASLDDDLETNIYPRFEGGMRDINAVQSSAFAVGRALIEDSRLREVSEYAAKIRLRALDLSVDAWKKHLDWNNSVISTYSGLHQLYYSVRFDTTTIDMQMQQKDALFDLQLYEYIKSMLGVVSGAQGSVSAGEPSQLSQSVSGAMGGAAVGYQVSGGNPTGAIVGGVVGLAASFL